MSEETYYQRNRETILNRIKENENDKERWKSKKKIITDNYLKQKKI